MSVAYGGPTDGSAPPGRVNFGWIGEAYRFVNMAPWIWVGSVLLYGIAQIAVSGAIRHAFANPNYIAPTGPFGGTGGQFGTVYGANSNLTPAGQALSLLFSWTFGAFQNASLYGMAVKQVRGGQLAFGDAFGGGSRWPQMLLLNLLLIVAYVAGIFALCVGLLIAVALFWPSQALVADGRGAVEAMSASLGGMKRDWLNAALLVLVFGLLLLVSLIPCGLGVFITIPMLHFMGALAYRDMVGMLGVQVPGAPAYGAAQPGVWPPPPGAAPPAWPPPPAGQTPPPSFGQPPPPAGQPPAPSWQTPAPPPRQSLSGDPVEGDDDRPPGTGPTT